MIINCNNHSDCSDEKMQRSQDYIQALEEERRKIQVFHRELPICLELVTQAIETRKQQLSGKTTEYDHNVISECSEQTSNEGPVLEEFIPTKRTLSTTVDDKQELKRSKNNTNVTYNDNVSKKSDWLRSVKLWNPTTDPPSKEDSLRNMSVLEVNRIRSGGAFHPFQKEKSSVTTPQRPIGMSAQVAASSSVEETSSGGGGGGNYKDEKEGQFQRKPRRSWSPELHRKFLQALQRLGGPQVATPKQIRDLMEVDGLTNDEVKSHLQKYRLHRRRPGHLILNNSRQAEQFVVVGGIWAPPPEYDAAMATKTTAATCNQIYAPIASRPPPPPLQRQQYKQFHSDDRASHTDDRARSRSPATSSSTHTITNSPDY
ncbi:transcription factor HHO3-like [Olea europaea subsp. europaea]|uniref:Transcription factor HHO3-like n=1 Tax=Olea europaea subsp. europaea TaxID=158383 RepID=A0A8S0RFY6_OLEEU|nr:transcription factor HHO3-like [Olea europaea subsp. europaea]